MTRGLPRLVLASGSPRRKELLETIGLPFTVEVSDADETVSRALPPALVVQSLAERKATAVAARLAESDDENEQTTLIIASDTVVALDGQILGKPANFDAAVDMLQKLEARTHTVFTGLCVKDALTGRQELGFSATDVTFRPLTREEIIRYVRTGEPMDKAGAYGIQGFGSTLVVKISGDYFTVVGLPLFLLSTFLKTFGVEVF
jgi:septum formation protein